MIEKGGCFVASRAEKRADAQDRAAAAVPGGNDENLAQPRITAHVF